jgi:hypothetical protein
VREKRERGGQRKGAEREERRGEGEEAESLSESLLWSRVGSATEGDTYFQKKKVPNLLPTT